MIFAGKSFRPPLGALIFSFILMFYIFTACDGGGGGTASSGAIAFKAVWPQQAQEDVVSRSITTDGTQDVCASFGIETITATVFSSSGTDIGGGSWPCDTEEHKGTIDSIPAGTGYRIVVEGIVTGDTRWRGEQSDIVVYANRATTLEKIVMHGIDIAVATHTIHSSAGEGGTIEPAGETQVVAGNDQQFTFEPLPGKRILDVVVDDVSQGAIPSYRFTGVVANHTISVSFDVAQYTITASAGHGGQIDPVGETTIAHGNTPTYTMAVDQGFYLASLLVNGKAVPAQTPYTFEPVLSNATIEARFKPVRFVDTGAAAGGDGTSWQSAFQTPEAAILAAVDGDEIWIKAGTYSLADQVSVNKSVDIFGGFTGTEHFLHQRNWSASPVIFDGQGKTRAFFISADARLDGLTIQNCTLGSGYTALQGGALFIANSSPVLANCTFLNNYIKGVGTCAGAAVYAGNSSPVFENVRLEGNYLECEKNDGGGMYLKNCTSTFKGNHFLNNKLKGGLGGDGAGMLISGGAATIATTQFTSNIAKSDGVNGGAICAKNVNLTVSECIFTGNVSGGSRGSYGGAIYHNGTATEAGSVIRNTIFLNNSAYFEYEPNYSHGGAIANNNANPSIINCTFFSNSARGYMTASGGAIANISGNPAITNTILWANQAHIDDENKVSDGEGFQLHDDATSKSTVAYSNIDQDGYDGNGNIRENPRLDALGRLQPGSACIDAGDDTVAPSIDIDGESRPENGRSDIGADELVDKDADQMADYWEKRYGLNISADDHHLDLDSDGLSNRYEYQMHLNPALANPVADARHRGCYYRKGPNVAKDSDARCGFHDNTEYRSYFIFDIPSIDGKLLSGALLRLELAEYQSIRQTEVLAAHGVTTDLSILESGASGQSATFDDLGDDASYCANLSISPTDVGGFVSFVLSAKAVDDIKASLDKGLAVGLSNRSHNVSDNNLTKFSPTSKSGAHQLILIMK